MANKGKPQKKEIKKPAKPTKPKDAWRPSDSAPSSTGLEITAPSAQLPRQRVIRV